MSRSKITESWNPISKDIDDRPLHEIVEIINKLDSEITVAIKSQVNEIAIASQKIVDTINRDGRVVFIGAGSSGRLGFQEASEIPPTFGLSSERFKAIIAGGQSAVSGSIEGAEDNHADGMKVVGDQKLTKKDTIIAITASGSTPFVLGAIEEAKKNGVTVIGITNNHDTPFSIHSDICIEAVVGPEVVAGSTRMRAGTAQKMILNTITTSAMMKLGYVHDGYMVGVQASNIKLRKRAKRIIQEITGASEQDAEDALSQSEGDVRVAVLMIIRKISLMEAREALDKFGSIRRALVNENDS